MAHKDKEQEQRTGSLGFHRVTEAETLDPEDTRVLATIPAAGTYAITLPDCSDALGHGIYTVTVEATSGGTSVTVQDNDETIENVTSNALTAVGDRVAFFSDGAQWHQLEDVTT